MDQSIHQTEVLVKLGMVRGGKGARGARGGRGASAASRGGAGGAKVSVSNFFLSVCDI